ncbi:hypothetical protein MIMGU_mgv1a017503mg [Erythranthe guttata]|uniref:Uncharacterized protein n=1 Tax=Erythranthe guttata TaxID=4155 RepID=A0A022Q8P6_ERYGU|nr:hypothetical protein MIMGU_mgv1a017503mg [Erythranthe guttata]
MIWHTQEVCIYKFPESLFVLNWRDNSWLLVFRNNERRFDQILELLIPCILPQIVYYATSQFPALSIHSHE